MWSTTSLLSETSRAGNIAAAIATALGAGLACVLAWVGMFDGLTGEFRGSTGAVFGGLFGSLASVLALWSWRLFCGSGRADGGLFSPSVLVVLAVMLACGSVMVLVLGDSVHGVWPGLSMAAGAIVLARRRRAQTLRR